MQIICAPDDIEVTTTEKGVVVVKIREVSELEIFLSAADGYLVEKIQNAIFEVKAKQLGLD
jgi:hypothetical protein